MIPLCNNNFELFVGKDFKIDAKIKIIMD